MPGAGVEVRIIYKWCFWTLIYNVSLPTIEILTSLHMFIIWSIVLRYLMVFFNV